MKNNSNGAFRSKHGYTVVQNEIVHDKRVSLKARGLYLTIQAYITMPGKTWLKSEFLRMVPEGEKAFNTAWNELKKAGYLKTHTYPTGGNWRHEYELLDEPMAGPHTFYYDAQGNPTKTNESRSNGETSDTDMAEGGNVDNFQHYPHFGSSADGSNAKGSSAKGNSANGGNNINTGYKYLKTTPNDNNSDTNPSINQATDGSIDAYEEPIILTACNSSRFIKDLSAFLDVMWQLVAGPVQLAVEACETTWTVKDMISYPVLDVTVAVILVVLVFAVITGLIYGLIGFVIYHTAKFYHEEFWDLLSGIVVLVSMGILVWFADTLTWITWNLILVWLLIHGAYVLIRMMMTSSKGSRY